MRREKVTVFLHTVMIGDHRQNLQASDEPAYKKTRVRLKVQKEEDGSGEESESIRITAFDFNFLKYVYNSL